MKPQKRQQPTPTSISAESTGRYDRLRHAIFNYAGIDRQTQPVKLPERHEASVKLFGVILANPDPRWRLVHHYLRLKNQVRFNDMNLENARRADYASPHASHYSQHMASATNKESMLQYARALTNLEIGHEAKRRFGQSSGIQVETWHDLEKGYRIRLQKTRNLQKVPDRDNIMGGPFALWQLQLFKEGQYVGRIGFNYHVENGRKVVSVNVIQGAENGNTAIKQAEKDLGAHFGDVLIRHLKDKLGPEFDFRGIIRDDKNKTLYSAVYRRSGVKERYRIPRLEKKYRNAE